MSRPSFSLEKKFSGELLATCSETAKLGYVADEFEDMLKVHGGVQTAKRLIKSKVGEQAGWEVSCDMPRSAADCQFQGHLDHAAASKVRSGEVAPRRLTTSATAGYGPITSRRPTTARNVAATASCASLPFDADVASVTLGSFPTLCRALHPGPFFRLGIGSDVRSSLPHVPHRRSILSDVPHRRPFLPPRYPQIPASPLLLPFPSNAKYTHEVSRPQSES